ncbi:cache domain-containing sensor histidine kinase [Extibacter muris]|uniref:cache domain-containing sensor histidine kinase n=1 Tax=Extibacter muris TaxID=1796622 RepID=UPI001D072315|nr:sensor histidine kinase [Extibacter muris]MCB6201649.1 sensor histidine kinase [Extibacter muris]MCQ4662975.1 sensor histidine kinase [Extibacter muris]MCQ4693241.1 sensor histidine kinase [Extibacter muris]
MKDKYFRRLNKVKPREIQSTIMIAFSLISLSLMMVLGIVMYIRFSNLSRQETVQSTQKLMEQTGENLEDYLVSMRQISDAAYYNVIKENDFASQDQDIQTKMNLLYEANRDNLRSIAIYNNHGSLRMAEPVAAQKEDPDVTRQDWYKQAMEEMENVHFSTPHIQNLFDDGTFRYYWVISLSRVVELTGNGVSQMGVLLVDMDYSSISRMMKQINTLNTEQYYYLCDSSGQIIYHPRQIQISDGIYNENSKAAAGYKDGVYDERFEGESRKVVVNTISYTGWKLVGVIPNATFTHGTVSIRYFIAILVLLMAMMLVVINRVVSVRISSPILKLDDSVKGYEAGETPEIYIGGSLEIRHLGHSIQRSYEQIDTLMKKIVLEQNERRKSELDALQSQINPHFLYNTLESIVWMVEGERNNEAVFMLSQLAKLFRISLSKGSTVITVKDELQHAQSYMNIQKIRYKNTFSITFHVDPAIYGYCTVKLILQPILENAINYGVSGMDDCGEITVAGRLEGSDLILAVTDNGMGMTREEAELVLTDSERVHKHGSGVGLVNVNNRIQILFGKEYGLAIESEPDEGTTVFIRLPAVLYTEENKKVLEQGHIFSMEEMNDREIGDEE